MSILRTKTSLVHVHDLLLNNNSDLHWSLLETFIHKNTLQNVLRVAVLVSDWLQLHTAYVYERRFSGISDLFDII